MSTNTKNLVPLFAVAIVLVASLLLFAQLQQPTALIGFAGLSDKNTMGEPPEDWKLHPELQQKVEELAGEEPEEQITVLLEIESGEDLNKIAELMQESGAEIEAQHEIGGVIVAMVPAGKLEEIAEQEEIVRVWPNRPLMAMLDESTVQVNAQSAWQQGYRGEGIKVAVLDTGIDASHQMLQGKVIAAASFVATQDVMDYHGHGTHVAGIAAGTREFGGAYSGVAPGAMLLNGKVLDDSGIGSTSTVVAGINWAVGQGVDVINLSLGGAYNDPNDPVNLAIRDAVAAGIVIVVASGNCGSGCPSAGCGGYVGVTTPGNSPDAITVGAVDASNGIACFSGGESISGIGIKPDVVAPGISIDSASSGGGYAGRSGTSMAAPHVSGAAAVLLQANPSASPAQIKELLERNAIDFGAAGKDTAFGSGLVDLSKLAGGTAGAPVFDYLSMPSMVKPNEAVAIEAGVVSSEEIIGVSATITKPGGTQSVLQLAFADGSWKGAFSESSETGEYLVEAVATGASGLQGTAAGTFAVSETAGLPTEVILAGASYTFYVPAEITKDTNAEFVVDYHNSSAQAVDVVVELTVRDVFGNIIVKENIGPETADANGSAALGYNWLATEVGAYSVGVGVFIDGILESSAEQGTKVVVPAATVIQSFTITPTSIEKGAVANYAIAVHNNSSTDFNAVVELDFTSAYGSIVGVLLSDTNEVRADQTFIFNLSEQMMLEAGSYDVNAVVHYGDKIVHADRNITVYTPAIGSVDGVNVPASVAVDANMPVGVTFRNSGSVPVDPVFTVQVLDGNEVVGAFDLESGTVQPNSAMVFRIAAGGGFGTAASDSNIVSQGAWEADVEAGNYDLNIITTYEGHEITSGANFAVIDTVAPVLGDVNFSGVLNRYRFNFISVSFTDKSSLNSVSVSVTGPGGNQRGTEMALVSEHVVSEEIPAAQNSSGWWDLNYRCRWPITIATKSGLDLNYTVDLAGVDLSGADFQADVDDLRITSKDYPDGIERELHREVIGAGTSNATARFKLTNRKPANSADDVNYFMYGCNPNASNPPSNLSKVYQWYDNFNSYSSITDPAFTGNYTVYCNYGTCSIGGGKLRIAVQDAP